MATLTTSKAHSLSLSLLVQNYINTHTRPKKKTQINVLVCSRLRYTQQLEKKSKEKEIINKKIFK